MSLCARVTEDDVWRELGDYKLEGVKIITNNDQIADIKGNVSEINVFEDLFGVFMSGNLTFTDAAGYTEKLPIVGNEKIVLEFKTPGLDDTKVYEFYVYSIPKCDREGLAANKEVKLNFCSLEMLANNLVRISKSVKGTQDEIVADLFNEYFAPLGKGISVEPALSEIKMPIPSWTPIETICFLASNAVSAENMTPSYVFFENNLGFVFGTLEKLKVQSPKIKYVSEPGPIEKLNLEKKFKRILSLKLSNASNLMTSTAGGLFGSNTVYQDPINKQIVEGHYSFDVKNTLGGNSPVFPKALEGLAKSNSHVTFRTVNADLFGEGEKSTSMTTADWEGRRKAYLNTMLNSRLVFTVTGNSALQIGDMIELSISGNDGQIDVKNSGKYIISALCHNFSPSGYFMSIEAITDGFGEVSGGIEE